MTSLANTGNVDRNTMAAEEKTKIIIVDDDPASIEVLANGLKEYAWAEICGTALSPEEGRALLDRHNADILFLDIEFDGESGIELAASLKEKMREGLKVVFYTSYRKYLIQALRLDAFDFLLKPFDRHELALIMNRWLMERNQSSERKIERIQLPVINPHHPISITTVTNDRLILSPDRIVFFKYDSKRKLWEAVLDNLKHLILKKQTTSETILNYGQEFVRTHKIYIVNVRYIAMLSGSNCILVPPLDKLDSIKVSKTYRHELLERFYDL